MCAVGVLSFGESERSSEEKIKNRKIKVESEKTKVKKINK
jgi:hypothetical protein